MDIIKISKLEVYKYNSVKPLLLFSFLLFCSDNMDKTEPNIIAAMPIARTTWGGLNILNSSRGICFPKDNFDSLSHYKHSVNEAVKEFKKNINDFN